MFVVLCIYIVCVACVVLSFELVCGGSFVLVICFFRLFMWLVVLVVLFY